MPTLLNEYDGHACRTAVGELAFFSISGEGMVTETELYLDLFGLLLRSNEVKELLLVPSMALEEVKIEELLQQAARDVEPKGRKLPHVTWFGLDKELQPLSEKYSKISVSYSLAYAWGIYSDELNANRE